MDILYADDIVVTTISPAEHFKGMLIDKDLSLNLDKTKLMVFSTTQARPESEFFFKEDKVANT